MRAMSVINLNSDTPTRTHVPTYLVSTTNDTSMMYQCANLLYLTVQIIRISFIWQNTRLIVLKCTCTSHS